MTLTGGIAKLGTRLLFLVGDGDHLYTAKQRIEIADRLRVDGVDHEFVVYPDTPHGFFLQRARDLPPGGRPRTRSRESPRCCPNGFRRPHEPHSLLASAAPTGRAAGLASAATMTAAPLAGVQHAAASPSLTTAAGTPSCDRQRLPLISMLGFRDKTKMIDPSRALRGRSTEMPVADRNAVLGTPLKLPFPEGFQQVVVGMGCFWGAERVFWQAPGVFTTAVGYAGGFTPNPTYEEVCSGSTGHDEVVLVVFDPAKASFEDMLRLFWENHDPTQGMRQGNDVGTQYRSAIYVSDEAQRAAAEASRALYAERLRSSGHPEITTEIEPAGPFYYAEDYHQQYLHKKSCGSLETGGSTLACRANAWASVCKYGSST